MDWLSNTHVCELGSAENDLIQVLLTKFSLSRHGTKAILEVSFDEKTPTIRRREAKRVLIQSMQDFASKANSYQEALDALLLTNTTSEFIHNDLDFAFRFASGGTLPILDMEGEEYYCLFYRDVYPIGWNIANGACDSLVELQNPILTIRRELCEELIIIDFDSGKDYVFSWEEGKTLQLPEYSSARSLWQQFFDKDFRDLRPEKISPQWQDGPDKLTIKMGDNTPKNILGCFLNINALDFGIEVDKIMRLKVTKDVVLLDGEIENGKLLNRPIGLFEVNKIEEQVKAGSKEYIPDCVFFGGTPHPHKSMEEIISEKYLPWLRKEGLRKREQISALVDTKEKYDLCPVTSSIIQRNIANRSTSLRRHKKKLFISYSSIDEDFARKVYTDLEQMGISCWFAPEDLEIGQYIEDVIHKAIHDGEKVLLVLSEHSINSPWVKREVQTAFDLEKKSGKRILLPIKIDNAVNNSVSRWVYDITKRLIGDFTDWNDCATYDTALNRLIRDLKKQIY
jgi:hypothetical protein